MDKTAREKARRRVYDLNNELDAKDRRISELSICLANPGAPKTSSP